MVSNVRMERHSNELLPIRKTLWVRAHPVLSSPAILQSSAAVGLLVAGFASNGYIGFPVALATILGADLGSALIIQVLSFRLDWLVPMLLTLGGWFFIKTSSNRFRQYGRILLGMAFILISLQLLRQAVVPIRDSDFLPAIATYLASRFCHCLSDWRVTRLCHAFFGGNNFDVRDTGASWFNSF